MLFFVMHHNWVDFARLEKCDPGKPTIVYDDCGNELMRFQRDRREPIPLEQMPTHLIQAFLATEDHNFFNHGGISWRGIARSIFVNLRSHKRAQGASTITQQLVRLLFLSQEKKFSRKLKEQLITLIVEKNYTKEQILELYLNNIYLGAGIYGVQAAAQRFWGIDARNLSPAQSATIAGIVRKPSYYCPLSKPENAVSRRNLILKLMLKHEYISENTYETACAEALNLHQHETITIAPHAREMIRLFLENLIENDSIYSAGLHVKITLHTEHQKKAEAFFKKHIGKMRELMPSIDGTLVSIDVQTGAIKALVGGYDFSESQFNRAIQATRQMGSTFKPFVYAAALEQEKNFAQTDIDEPLTGVTGWNPRNVHRRFDGRMTLAHALATSNNIIPIKILLDIGADSIIDVAQRCHLQGPFQPYPSLALGCVDSTALQAAASFNVFANKGIYTEPYLIEWVKDQWGKKIWKHRPIQERALAWSVTSQIVQILKNALIPLQKRMPNWWIKGEGIGKTGTTNDARTCWFVGSTPQHTTAVYIGCDNNTPMSQKIYSVRHAVPLWLAFNRICEDPQATFFYDPQLTRVIINKKTGELLDDDSHPLAAPILLDTKNNIIET